jgi:predicted MFS family arabinose efflux permease
MADIGNTETVPTSQQGILRASPVGLILFTLGLHIINQIDRQLVAGFASDIMHDLELSRSQFALIAGLAFSGVYAIAALTAGVMADRVGRVRVLASGLGVWSLFTALTGLAQGFWSLLGARPFVAAGEATLVPTATNIILARVSQRHRAAALGLFFAGIPIGSGGGFLIAAKLGPVIGWRWVFVGMGMIGLLAVMGLSRIKDRAPELAERPTLIGNLGAIFTLWRKVPRIMWASLAIILAHAHSATSPFVQLWLVAEKGYDKSAAAALYGATFVIAGLIGTFGSGVLGDWAARRYGWDRAQTVFVMLLALGPLLLCYRLAPGGSALFLAGMVGSILFMTVLYGPIFAVIEELLPAPLKATSTGLNMLLINIFAIGAVSLAIGIASDRLAAAGSAQSWTWPLLGADILALLAIPCAFLAMRSAGAALGQMAVRANPARE